VVGRENLATITVEHIRQAKEAWLIVFDRRDKSRSLPAYVYIDQDSENFFKQPDSSGAETRERTGAGAGFFPQDHEPTTS